MGLGSEYSVRRIQESSSSGEQDNPEDTGRIVENTGRIVEDTDRISRGYR